MLRLSATAAGYVKAGPIFSAWQVVDFLKGCHTDYTWDKFRSERFARVGRHKPPRLTILRVSQHQQYKEAGSSWMRQLAACNWIASLFTVINRNNFV